MTSVFDIATYINEDAEEEKYTSVITGHGRYVLLLGVVITSGKQECIVIHDIQILIIARSSVFIQSADN